jgi:hypothetical protein
MLFIGLKPNCIIYVAVASHTAKNFAKPFSPCKQTDYLVARSLTARARAVNLLVKIYYILCWKARIVQPHRQGRAADRELYRARGGKFNERQSPNCREREREIEQSSFGQYKLKRCRVNETK